MTQICLNTFHCTGLIYSTACDADLEFMNRSEASTTLITQDGATTLDVNRARGLKLDMRA
jgi:hypothetical protein